jgi:xanthine dehydrogenase accessory factor
MTHAHAHDRTVLAGALKTPARYIGMIASRRKRDVIFRSLVEEGVAAEALARVHSPIGLDIGARSPAEIAVSIAAELIAVRAKNRVDGDATSSGAPSCQWHNKYQDL